MTEVIGLSKLPLDLNATPRVSDTGQVIFRLDGSSYFAIFERELVGPELLELYLLALQIPMMSLWCSISRTE